MKTNLLFIIKDNSLLEERILNFYKFNEEYSITFLSIDEIENLSYIPDDICAVIFEEIESSITSAEFLSKIRNALKTTVPIIILGSNSEVPNVVRWMRSGVTDYIDITKLSEETLNESLADSFSYISQKTGKPVGPTQNCPSYGNRINLNTSADFSDYTDLLHYDMTLAMISIRSENSNEGRYSDDSYEMLCDKFRNEIDKEAASFGGKVWFWNKETGVCIFMNDQKSNHAVLFATYLYFRFFMICLERLQLEEVFNIKICIHSGNGVYHATNTEQITSDVINTLIHLGTRHGNESGVYISENVISELSGRLKIGFDDDGLFESIKVFKLKEF